MLEEQELTLEQRVKTLEDNVQKIADYFKVLQPVLQGNFDAIQEAFQSLGIDLENMNEKT